MKKQFLMRRSILVGAMLAAGGGAFAFGVSPAGAAATPPQIGLVTGHSGSATVTLGPSCSRDRSPDEVP